MLLVVILTLVMQYSRTEHAATDFTFQVSIMATVSGGLYTLSGFVGDALGYFNFLVLALLIGGMSLWVILNWLKILENN